MNNPSANVSGGSKVRRVVFWILALCALSGLAVVALALNTITLDRDARLLRNEILAAIDRPSSTQVQLSVGPTIIGSVRLGLVFCADAPREARIALKAVSDASVGVYRLKGGSRDLAGAKLFAMSDRAMNDRGWTRVVGVNQNNESVLVYMPTKSSEHGTQRVCVAVCKRDQLVVVSGTANLESLVELAQTQRDFHLARL